MIVHRNFNNILPPSAIVSNSWWNTGYSAPTQALLQRWLREEYNIDIFIESGYCYIIQNEKTKIIETFLFPTYEEALEEGLLSALKMIRKEKK